MNRIIGAFKALFVIVFFLLSCASIVITQAIGVLFSFSPDMKEGWICNTKTHFIIALITSFRFLSSTPIHLNVSTSNPKLRKRIMINESGSLQVNLCGKIVVIANHQIYTDWAYIWYLLFKANGLSSFIYIMLKDSLKHLPILGFGMQRFRFIFLSRSWKSDEITMGNALSRIDADARGKGTSSGCLRDLYGEFEAGIDKNKTWPFALVLFPEGTNLSANTRGKSEAYALKNNKPIFKHVLLPKTTGLRYSLLKLKDSTDEVIDLTMGYSGVKPEEYGQDIYKLEDILINGKNPDTVSLHLETLSIRDIPIGKLHYTDPEEEARDKAVFEEWVFQRWAIKDELMDRYYKTGKFVDNDDDIVKSQLEYEWFNIISIFLVPGLLIILALLVGKYYPVLEEIVGLR
ncbi:hypothetical protein WICPIJ_004152 [Wickerhamomyces pijperi]|uniref:Phospholipid/glycerol acyltransferase domain-containing protein n=1 Tax=Wickerhamomyces pijperi TaxID=599730 RepID=A0A9P8TN66_WICPI|nr:hypothetical protein WICPIJ_004152 [Wickerhamomyces pijperi]